MFLYNTAHDNYYVDCDVYTYMAHDINYIDRCLYYIAHMKGLYVGNII